MLNTVLYCNIFVDGWIWRLCALTIVYMVIRLFSCHTICADVFDHVCTLYWCFNCNFVDLGTCMVQPLRISCCNNRGGPSGPGWWVGYKIVQTNMEHYSFQPIMLFLPHYSFQLAYRVTCIPIPSSSEYMYIMFVIIITTYLVSTISCLPHRYVLHNTLSYAWRKL